MSSRESQFSSQEEDLFPGHLDKAGAVREKALYGSKDKEVATRPQGREGDGMETEKPDDFDVAEGRKGDFLAAKKTDFGDPVKVPGVKSEKALKKADSVSKKPLDPAFRTVDPKKERESEQVKFSLETGGAQSRSIQDRRDAQKAKGQVEEERKEKEQSRYLMSHVDRELKQKEEQDPMERLMELHGKDDDKMNVEKEEEEKDELEQIMDMVF